MKSLMGGMGTGAGRELLGTNDILFPEFFQLADEIAVAGGEFFVGVLVGVAGPLEGIVDALHVLGEPGVLLVDLADGVEDVVEGAALVVLAPEEGDEAEGGEEAAGAGEDDVGAGGGFEEGGFGGEGEGEGGFGGDEEEDEVGGAVLEVGEVGVAAGGEALDVGFEGGEEVAEGGGTGVGVGGVGVVHVGLEGHFGVDEDATVVGEADDGVGLGASALAVGDGDLEVVVASWLEAGGFEEAGEGEFAPGADGFVVALEGVGEVVGFLSEVAALGGEEFDLLLEGAALLEVGGVDLFDLLLEVGDFLAEGGEEEGEGFAVLVGEFAGLGVEDLGGEELELAGEVFAGGGEGVELGLEADGIGAGGFEAGGGAVVGEGVAEGGAEEEGGEDGQGDHGEECSAGGGGNQPNNGRGRG